MAVQSISKNREFRVLNKFIQFLQFKAESGVRLIAAISFHSFVI